MSNVGQCKRFTQQQVLRFFRNGLGYRYLGDRKYRSTITETLYETNSKREADG
ncbi:hypothetical protein [Halorhodospira abdelmalekii]|uniref:hypothetical protein n=1 Tax=Halorhodospira abdelmalekii TaxID=421629 RepID=UPI0019048BFC|nr:hypothetical protein [Halorhodospira abdelmalekii]